jgi:hypothetical protein
MGTLIRIMFEQWKKKKKFLLDFNLLTCFFLLICLINKMIITDYNR